jgi:PAS domain S-box-containing protein
MNVSDAEGGSDGHRSPLGSLNGPGPESRERGRASILIVDDQQGNIRALESLLGDLGQDLVCATTGQEALASLLERDFAVILLDVRMPSMDGFETAELIRRRRRSRHIPIIFVTAVDDDVAHIVRGYSLGAVDYIMKPLNGDILRSKVKVFIDLCLQGRELADRTAEVTEKNRALQREIAKRERVERMLSQSRDFYLALFDEFPTLVWRSDESGKVSYFNRSWLTFVGRTLEQEKQSWEQGLHPEDRDRCLRMLNESFQARQPFELEYRHRRKDGEYRWMFNCGRPYRNLEGNFAGFVGSCADITPRRKSEEETQAVNAELEAFSYTVSHDLRAPLRAMSGFCQILSEDYAGGEKIDQTWRDYVKRISDAATHMDNLIRDLLAFSKIARGQISLEPINLTSLMAEVVEELRLTGNPVTVETPTCSVLGNRVLLFQVFSNLISNGLKFVPPGVLPKVRVRSEEGADGRIRVWVEDNGIGIAPEYQEKIFNVFERLNEATVYPGTGIGLAIVRRAVVRMGGAVGVVSVEHEGSRFWVDLSRADAPTTLPSQAE